MKVLFSEVKQRGALELVPKQQIREVRGFLVEMNLTFQHPAGDEGEVRSDETLVLLAAAVDGVLVLEVQLFNLALELLVSGDGEVEILHPLREYWQDFFEFFGGKILENRGADPKVEGFGFPFTAAPGEEVLLVELDLRALHRPPLVGFGLFEGVLRGLDTHGKVGDEGPEHFAKEVPVAEAQVHHRAHVHMLDGKE